MCQSELFVPCSYGFQMRLQMSVVMAMGENEQNDHNVVYCSFQQRTTKEWLVALDGAGIPCGSINNIQQVFEDPQVCCLFYFAVLIIKSFTFIATEI